MEVADLESRVERLEKRNRLLTGTLALFLTGASAVLIMGHAQTKGEASSLEVEKLTVVDGAGKGRARFGILGDGSVGFVLHDLYGKPRAELSVGADGLSRMVLSDLHGKPRAEVRVGPDMAPRLVFTDSEGKNRIVVGVQADGTPRLMVNDKNGKPVALPIP